MLRRTPVAKYTQFKSEGVLATIQAIFFRTKDSSYDQKEWYLTKDAPNAAERAKAIEKKRMEYATVQVYPDVSPCLMAIPESEYLFAYRRRHYQNIFSVGAAKVFMNILGFFGDIKSKFLRDPNPYYRFENIFQWDRNASIAPVPYMAKREYKSDEEYALRRLIGMNPTMLRRVDKIDDVTLKKCPLAKDEATLEQLRQHDVLPAGYTIQKLIDEQRLFVCDYKELEPIRFMAPLDRNLMAPICFFFKSPNNGFRPLSIQLGQEHSLETYPIFTPCDPAGAWHLAKLHVECADASVLEVSRHLQATHLVAESTYVTMNRNMSVQHPLSAWLTQHFFYTVNINVAARVLLIGPQGSVPALFPIGYEGTVGLLRKAAKEFDWSRYHIPSQYKNRGIVNDDGTSLIPGNFVVDDALRLWKILEDFVTAMVKNIMVDDATVKNDKELQNWVRELTTPLGAMNDPGQGHALAQGFPGTVNSNNIVTVDTIADLTRWLTTVLWLCTGEHASVNNGAYETYAFVPYLPFTIKLGANASKIDIPEQEIANAMFSRADAAEAASFVRLLTLPSKDILGTYDGPFFSAAKRASGDSDAYRKEQVAIIDKMKEELVTLTGKIERRNDRSGNPYPYLDPKQVGMAIYE